MTYITHSPEETEQLGAAVASSLGSSPAFIALYGDMGAGKTAFVRGLASVLSPGSRVKSPTYTIVNEYRRGTLALFHFDLCRLSDANELDSFGFDEYVTEGHCVVEWADILGDDLPDGAIRITIERDGENDRTVTVSPDPTAHGFAEESVIS